LQSKFWRDLALHQRWRGGSAQSRDPRKLEFLLGKEHGETIPKTCWFLVDPPESRKKRPVLLL